MDKHVDQMVMQPTRHFDNPDEVLSHPGLKYKDRVRILESWKLDAQRLAESTAENMSGGEQGDLSEVSRALLQLKGMDKLPRAIQRGDAQRPVAAGMAIGGLLGAGAGLVAAAATTTVSLPLIVQTSIVGVIVGGIAGALRSPQREKEL